MENISRHYQTRVTLVLHFVTIQHIVVIIIFLLLVERVTRLIF
jgi:hypothetical protein